MAVERGRRSAVVRTSQVHHSQHSTPCTRHGASARYGQVSQKEARSQPRSRPAAPTLRAYHPQECVEALIMLKKLSPSAPSPSAPSPSSAAGAGAWPARGGGGGVHRMAGRTA